MGDLKHKSPSELCSLISWCVKKRAEIDKRKGEVSKQIEALQAELCDLGRQSHNIGQKEAWARIWLARKT